MEPGQSKRPCCLTPIPVLTVTRMDQRVSGRHITVHLNPSVEHGSWLKTTVLGP